VWLEKSLFPSKLTKRLTIVTLRGTAPGENHST
jgi:hypothetical protein